MLVPLSWLKEFIPLTQTPQEIDQVLTLAGLEVDKVEKCPLKFTNVVVGEVLKTEKHPDADSLCIAQVSNGKETLQVVCGASNCRPGLKTAFAQIGATLENEEGKITKIKKGKLRGVESFGMLCGFDELGLAAKQEGMIVEFPADTPVGKPLEELYGDLLFEISLTPNLGYCMSILGVARELGILLNLPLSIPKSPLREKLSGEKIVLKMEDPTLCSLYAARVVEIPPTLETPEWISRRLELCGHRSINPIVDVTNYVMLEMGHPLHAFDLDRLQSKTITLALTTHEEAFTTLDDANRTLPAGTLVVKAGQTTVAIAGVMGGKNSAVHEGTKRILLEGAHFDATAVRRSSKLAKVRTDASSRFEKGVDPLGASKALARACSLYEMLGCNVGKEQSKVLTPYHPRTIDCRLSRVNGILGTSLSLGEVSSLLEQGGIKVEQVGETLRLTPPSYRTDLTTEIECIEEVARLYGYNAIEYSTPAVHPSNLPHSPIYLLEQRVRSTLLTEGLQEMLTCDLISPKAANACLTAPLTEANLISVLQPSSIDQSLLRTTLLPGLLLSLRENFDHQIFDISAFEIGRIHFKEVERYSEREVVSLILTGKERPHHWGEKPADVNFFHLKGIVENFVSHFDLDPPCFEKSSLQTLHPGKQAHLICGKLRLGTLGEVHPSLLKEFEIDRPVLFAEIDLLDLLSSLKPEKQMKPLPQFPGIERDWTITVPNEVSAASIIKALRSVPSSLLREVQLLDLYQSEKLGAGKKNLTFRLFYRSESKTLETASVEKEHLRILALRNH